MPLFSTKLRSITRKKDQKSASGKPAYCKVPVPASVDDRGKKCYGSSSKDKLDRSAVTESAKKVVSRLIGT
jgi:hypothetical protein